MIAINIVLASALIIITILIHSYLTRFIMFLIKHRNNPDHRHYKRPNEYWISMIVLMIFAISIVESVVWALAYLMTGTLTSIEESLYFSIVTYTTLGYGDITISGPWRLLAASEAAIGIIIFGWSTAIVMAVVQKLYLKKLK